MIDYQTLCVGIERQMNIMRDELNRREYENLVKSAELFSTYLKVKLGELDEKGKESEL